MNRDSRIYVAGHLGLVGSAVLRLLKSRGFSNLFVRAHVDMDLTDQQMVQRFFDAERPEYVFLCAAKVGGIRANASQPVEFLSQNTFIGFHVLNAAYRSGVKKLLNLGSSCIYPRDAPQPLKEEYLLSGPLEATNEAYTIAKLSVIKLCSAYNREFGTNYLSVMPTNLYGLGDNYDLASSHVLPALIRKFHDAKTSGTHRVVLWGDGSPRREFLYSEDLAEALLLLMETKDASDIGELINIGAGTDLTIRALADLVRTIVYADAPGKDCRIEWDTSMPNGVPRKLLDASRMRALGWSARTALADGIARVYDDFTRNGAARIIAG